MARLYVNGEEYQLNKFPFGPRGRSYLMPGDTTTLSGNIFDQRDPIVDWVVSGRAVFHVYVKVTYEGRDPLFGWQVYDYWAVQQFVPVGPSPGFMTAFGDAN